MKVQLIIGGKVADLNEDGLILLTFQGADAGHPAAVMNSYSQSVVLPSTAGNDAIFSHILRSDFRTAGGFNPIERTPFEIRNEAQEILVSGYLKLNSGEAGKGYDITLYGGLGGFFYSLKYKANGDKRTLADMEWGVMVAGQKTYLPTTEVRQNMNAGAIAQAWNGQGFDATSFFNFAPFREGKPQDFAANKAYYKGDDYAELPLSRTDGGKTYTPLNSGGGVIVDLSNEHDAFGMQEFRNTQLRPVWSVSAFLDAICQSQNNGGYDVYIDTAFTACNLVKKGWITGRLGWGADIDAMGHITAYDALKDTQSPADYLLSLAKVCGLMFTFDEATHRVQILTRDSYYGRFQHTRFSLHGMIAEDKSKTITPLLITDRFQTLGAENYGGRAEDFKERTGRDYGSMRFDTSYPFGDSDNAVLSESILKGAADTLATSIDYRVLLRGADVGQTYLRPWLKFIATDSVKYKLYTTEGAERVAKEFTPDFSDSPLGRFHAPYEKYFNDSPYGNIAELPELCGEDGAAQDGADILVFYRGMQTLPSGNIGSNQWRVVFRVTQAHEDMLELNGGKPCWDLSDEGYAVTQYPLFQRQISAGRGWSALFARPGEFFTPNAEYIAEIPAEKYIGARMWEKWLTERCDVNTRRMKCWVNLRSGVTPKVSADLLSYFWYYEGAWWVLDKINGHSITTDALTECEFVKVVDMQNYLSGQDYG